MGDGGMCLKLAHRGRLKRSGIRCTHALTLCIAMYESCRHAWMAQLVRAQVSYLRMTAAMVGNPEVMSSILIPSKIFVSAHPVILAMVPIAPQNPSRLRRLSIHQASEKASRRGRGYKQCILYLSIQSSQRFQRAFNRPRGSSRNDTYYRAL